MPHVPLTLVQEAEGRNVKLVLKQSVGLTGPGTQIGIGTERPLPSQSGSG